jgi:hypothetical protein
LRGSCRAFRCQFSACRQAGRKWNSAVTF